MTPPSNPCIRMEIVVLHLTTFCLTSSTNLAKTGLDSKGRSLNIPVMIQMKDNRKLAPKIEILWIIERRKQNPKINFLKQDQMNWKLKLKQRLIGCTLLPRKLKNAEQGRA